MDVTHSHRPGPRRRAGRSPARAAILASCLLGLAIAWSAAGQGDGPSESKGPGSATSGKPVGGPRVTQDPNDPNRQDERMFFKVYPIGKVVRRDGKTLIVLKEAYRAGLKGLDAFKHVTVVYWFDRNDTPEKRSILQVHPRGNPKNPIRGVFATHAPVRPNLIAISRCKLIAVRGGEIEIDKIDAFDDSPVLDLKN